MGFKSPLHVTHASYLGAGGTRQPQCSTQGPSPVLSPVPWSRASNCGRKPTWIWGEHAHSTQRGSVWSGFKPRTSFWCCSSANHYTTVPPFFSTFFFIWLQNIVMHTFIPWQHCKWIWLYILQKKKKKTILKGSKGVKWLFWGRFSLLLHCDGFFSCFRVIPFLSADWHKTREPLLCSNT